MILDRWPERTTVSSPILVEGVAFVKTRFVAQALVSSSQVCSGCLQTICLYRNGRIELLHRCHYI